MRLPRFESKLTGNSGRLNADEYLVATCAVQLNRNSYITGICQLIWQR
jgi:hypothetical protein